MKVELGQTVYGRDGQKIGNIDGIVIDARTNEVQRILIDQGIFSGPGRLVELSAIERSEGSAVYLDIPAGEAEQLPRFVETEHTEAEREAAAPFLLPSSAGTGRVFYDNRTSGAGYPGSGSFFDPAPVDPPPLEVDSNLTEAEVVLGKGTDVVGADGDKVGTVDDVFTDARGDLEGFLVRAGFLFKHDVRVPMAWVESVGHDHVRLNVTADEAERRGKA